MEVNFDKFSPDKSGNIEENCSVCKRSDDGSGGLR
jgi:hypothetical protein